MDPEETRRFGHLTATQLVDPIGFAPFSPLTLVARPRTTQIVQKLSPSKPLPKFPVGPWLSASPA